MTTLYLARKVVLVIPITFFLLFLQWEYPVASVFEDSKILSDIWSDSQLKVVRSTQKLSAMRERQRTKKRNFILTPLDFLKLLGFRPLKFSISIK